MKPNVNKGKGKVKWNARTFAKCGVCGEKWVTGMKWIRREVQGEFVCPVCRVS